ncbi:D-inositol-3-phosphate glycosyltransferase [subsurface metagenome]
MKVAILGPHPADFFGSKLDFSNDKTVEHPSPWIVNLCKSLSKFIGIELHLIALSKNIRCSQTFHYRNITYHFLKYYKERFRLATLYQFDRWRIYRRIREIRPDILHSHGTEDIYSYASVTSGYPCLVSLQGIINEVIKYETNRLLSPMRLIKYFEKYTIRRAKYINAKTPYAFNCVKKFISNKSKIFFMEDPVSERYFEVQNYEGKNRILFVGTIIKRKGIEDLIQSIYLLKEKIRNIKLRIIGWGREDYQNQMLNYINNNNLQANIDFLGFKNSEEIADELSKSCLLVLPSYIENCPNVVLEAMAAGKPVVATNVGVVFHIW